MSSQEYFLFLQPRDSSSWLVPPTVRPFVSGRKRKTKAEKKANRTAKGRKVKLSSFGMRTRGKMRLTNRLAAQLMKTTTELAADLEKIFD